MDILARDRECVDPVLNMGIDRSARRCIYKICLVYQEYSFKKGHAPVGL